MKSDSISTHIANFIGSLSYADIPENIVTIARLHMADAIGVGLGASSFAPQKDIIKSTLKQSATGAATVFGAQKLASAQVAALLNGMATHSMEYDDTHMSSVVHGSSVIVPTVLALAESENLDLQEMVRLIVIGWELLIRIGLASPGNFQKNGFQITSVGGAVIAAALASAAKASSITTLKNAMGIAGSQASGIFEFLSNGSNVKSLHPGWAAHSGIWASILADGGMTGPETVIEGRFGLFNTFARDPQANDKFISLIDSLGSDWLLHEAAFKLYPCCHYIHSYLEAGDNLMRSVSSLEDIKQITCYVADGMADIICKPWARKQNPENFNDVKYSLPYCLALSLLGNSVDLNSVTSSEMNPDALKLAGKISWEVWPASNFPKCFDAKLICTTNSGENIEIKVDQVLGSQQRPADESRIKSKFINNVACLSDEKTAQELWAVMLNGKHIGDLQAGLRNLVVAN